MELCNIVLSVKEPRAKNCIWAKPVDGGFTIYLLDGGCWKPVITVNDNDTPYTTADDVAEQTKNKVDKVSTSTITNNFVAFSNNKSGIKDSGKKASDFEVAGTAATLIAQAVIGQAGGITYKGTVNADADLPAEPENGWQYVVATAGTYQSETLAVGDYLIYNAGTTSWDIIKK